MAERRRVNDKKRGLQRRGGGRRNAGVDDVEMRRGMSDGFVERHSRNVLDIRDVGRHRFFESAAVRPTRRQFVGRRRSTLMGRRTSTNAWAGSTDQPVSEETVQVGFRDVSQMAREPTNGTSRRSTDARSRRTAVQDLLSHWRQVLRSHLSAFFETDFYPENESNISQALEVVRNFIYENNIPGNNTNDGQNNDTIGHRNNTESFNNTNWQNNVEDAPENQMQSDNSQGTRPRRRRIMVNLFADNLNRSFGGIRAPENSPVTDLNNPSDAQNRPTQADSFSTADQQENVEINRVRNTLEQYLQLFDEIRDEMRNTDPFFVQVTFFSTGAATPHREVVSKNDLAKVKICKWTPDNPIKNCTICLEDFAEEQNIRVLGCDHCFHDKCGDEWLLKMANTCPICRKVVAA